ncbi:MAG: CueP family metal-binding protein [Leucobacter sp.]
MKRPRSFTLTVASVIAAFALAGCASAQPSDPPITAEGSILAKYDLDGLDTREVIEALDGMPIAERPDGLATSIRANHVSLADSAGQTAELPLLKDIVYISAAPYRTQTHDCYYHSPTSCIGELQNTEVDVEVTDLSSGEVLVNESLRTFDNGFFGLWLPRDIEAQIVVNYQGQSASSTLSTAGDDVQTCITTLQLT